MSLLRVDLPGIDLEPSPSAERSASRAGMIRTAAFVGGVFSLAACAFALMLLALSPVTKPDPPSHLASPVKIGSTAS